MEFDFRDVDKGLLLGTIGFGLMLFEAITNRNNFLSIILIISSGYSYYTYLFPKIIDGVQEKRPMINKILFTASVIGLLVIIYLKIVVGL